MSHRFILKDKIDATEFIELYGEKGQELVNEFIARNSEILKDFKEDKTLLKIHEETNVDLTKPFFNHFIESKLKDITINNLKKKLKKETRDSEEIIDRLYRKSIAYKGRIQKLKGQQKQEP